MFFNRIVGPRFIGIPGDQDAADLAERSELPPILDYIERVAPEGDGYLVGDSLTVADISVASPFVNLRHLRTELDESRYPKTIAYVQRILSRPALLRSWKAKPPFSSVRRFLPNKKTPRP
ncbi:glutathione S-transferase family protein [Sphingomonas daechungensis]|uniref:glutathione S-transferase family protein n=1 Tax=Sphingomonas daechungensis TaxID=1176646 RepID=UPI001CB9AA51|nr:glutathione S-transferase family protein [Sphingomonas daechungensis]